MRSLRTRFFAAASALALIAPAAPALPAPVSATSQQPADKHEEPARPITQRDPSAVDVVATPMSDLNLRKGEIPQILIDAQAAPYALRDLNRCAQIAAEVGRLDAALGDDIDIAQSTGRRISAGKVAQSVIGGFIPFRGIIREISGANDQQYRMQTAIYAGSARRSFLKGIGQQRGCAWPARSATPAMLATIAKDNKARGDAHAKGDAGPHGDIGPNGNTGKTAPPAPARRPRR